MPGVMEIDRRRIVIADADDGMTYQIKHHRPASVDLRFVHGKRKSPSIIICFLVITVGYRIAPGFVKKFSTISSIIPA